VAVTDEEKIQAVEFALDRELRLEAVKTYLGIDHSDSDDLLRLLIASINLGDQSRWNL
jgi:hypothetical protein